MLQPAGPDRVTSMIELSPPSEQGVDAAGITKLDDQPRRSASPGPFRSLGRLCQDSVVEGWSFDNGLTDGTVTLRKPLNTAPLLIDPRNAASLAVAQRTGFDLHGDVDGQFLFKRPLRTYPL